VVKTEWRSQKIAEQYLKQHGICRRELLHSPHFLSIQMVIASTDLVVTVSASIGELFRQIADLQVPQPHFPIPFIDVKQYWHRYRSKLSVATQHRGGSVQGVTRLPSTTDRNVRILSTRYRHVKTHRASAWCTDPPMAKGIGCGPDQSKRRRLAG
jgi:hypothetical protein